MKRVFPHNMSFKLIRRVALEMYDPAAILAFKVEMLGAAPILPNVLVTGACVSVHIIAAQKPKPDKPFKLAVNR
jgi:hypothetical protein